MQLLRQQKSPEATDDLYSLACGPDNRVTQYTGCIVNGIRFHSKEREKYRRTQNSGVVVKVYEGDKEIQYYGVLTNIIELDYCFKKRVILFKCDWWDVGNKKTGIHTDAYFTSVNVSRTCYENDPYVLASQAIQVFYLKDTKLRGDWQVVQMIKPRNVYDVLEVDEEERDSIGGDAFQQEEQLDVDGIVRHHQTPELMDNEENDEEVEPLSLNRTDVDAYEVDANVVVINVESDQTDVGFINDDESDAEDDTLMDYCTDEEEQMPTDDDTDIDS